MTARSFTAHLIVCVLALLLRAPLITADSPYFYHEDDAHHFNRTVRMVQEGDLNPHYFNKPSLHFYLRIPVVVASVHWLKSTGELRSSKEIRTRDPYGLSGYAFTTSHPLVLEWNRALSVFFSVIIVLLTYLCALRLGLPIPAAAFAALVPAVSPEVVKNSHIIGVDIVMALFCIATSYASLLILERYSPLQLALCGLLGGLACSSKYNAAPIVFAPLCAAFAARGFSLRAGFICGTASLLGFLLGSPFILWEPQEFWRGLTYEIWHYSVAGHEQHSANRGLEQALFYARWILSDGAGIAISLLCLGGVVLAMRARNAQMLVLLSFPIAYTLLMVLQKTNFTRNMVCLLPYVGLASALAVARLPVQTKAVRVIALLLSVAALAQPFAKSLEFVASRVRYVDSRDVLGQWLTNSCKLVGDIAVAGTLQVPIALLNKPGVDAFNPEKTSAVDLYQSGYDLVAVPVSLESTKSDLKELPLVASFGGAEGAQRAPNSPAINIRRLSSDVLPTSTDSLPSIIIDLNTPNPLVGCGGSQEGHCWTRHRRTLLEVRGSRNEQLDISSPWAPQTILIRNLSGMELQKLHLHQPGERHFLAPSISNGTFIFEVTAVHSPASLGIGNDTRRLGAMIRPQGVVQK